MSESFRSAHFSRKHLLIARVSRMLDGLVYTQRSGLARGMRRKGGLGFLPGALFGGAPTAEEEFFQKLDLAGQTVYDVGSFQGLLTLFFSRRAARVVAYEPNPASAVRVQKNLELNGVDNVTLRNTALGAEPGVLTLTLDPLMPGAASADPSLQDQIRGSGQGIQQVEVPVARLDDDIAAMNLPQPDFVKIDVEGFELPVLQGFEKTIREARPAFYLEMHGATPEEKRVNVAALVEFLNAAGYSDIRHIESGAAVRRENSEVAAEGHLYCPRPS